MDGCEFTRWTHKNPKHLSKYYVGYEPKDDKITKTHFKFILIFLKNIVFLCLYVALYPKLKDHYETFLCGIIIIQIKKNLTLYT